MTEFLGRIGKVIDHNIDRLVEVIVETRSNYNQKAYIYNSSGEDSVPVKDDKVIIFKVDGTGRHIMMGWLTISQKAKPGEKIFFGRDQKGKITSKIKMLNDGTYSLDTETETTGEATGNYKKIIKGVTNIEERKDRTYLNEKNVTNTINENKDQTILGDQNTAVGGNSFWGIEGNLEINVTGNITINAGGVVKINGAHIGLND